MENLERINKVVEFYRGRGVNKESVNRVHRKIVKQENVKKVLKS